MDQQKLRTLVFEKTGVRIDLDDPVFALVALNEAVLEEAVERHIAAIDSATRELVQHARIAGGLPPASDAHTSARISTDTPGPAVPPVPLVPAHAAAPLPGASLSAPSLPAMTRHEWRLLGAAAGVAVLSALLVLAGQAAFSQPGPTPAQSQALQEAQRLTAAIDKLDPKLRAEVQAQLQK
ncbi:MAG: hypothetical protein ABW069_13505 [Duganella sp.]